MGDNCNAFHFNEVIIKFLLLFISILFGALGQILLKVGVNNNNFVGFKFYLDFFKNYWIYLGMFSYGISFLLWLKVLKYFEVSFARPMTSLGYILTLLIAVIILGESINLSKIIGIVLIVTGVFFLMR